MAPGNQGPMWTEINAAKDRAAAADKAAAVLSGECAASRAHDTLSLGKIESDLRTVRDEILLARGKWIGVAWLSGMIGTGLAWLVPVIFNAVFGSK